MANPCPLSMAMAAAWQRCRQGTPAAALAVFGPLHGLVQDSGGSFMKRGQHYITQFRGKEGGQLLHGRMGALDRTDPVKMAHFSVVGSSTATVVYTSWPRSGHSHSCGAAKSAASSVCREAHCRDAGIHRGSNGHEFGFVYSFTRGGLRRRHDQVKWSLLEALRAMGMMVRPEVHCTFSSVNSVNSALANNHMQANQRERQGLDRCRISCGEMGMVINVWVS